MATIALYAGKLNQMPGLIKDAKKSVDKLKTELSDLQKKAYNVDTDVCDLSEVISSIQASAQTQENRIAALENFQTNSEEFINEVIRIDNNVADTVNQNKENFYKQYDYLKPESEKSEWEKFCDCFESVGEWCKAHWKEIVIGLVCIIVGAVLTVLTGGSFLAALLLGLKAALTFAAISGGISAGLTVIGSILSGDSVGTVFGKGIRAFFDAAPRGFMSGGIFSGAFFATNALSTFHVTRAWFEAAAPTIHQLATVTKTISLTLNGTEVVSFVWSFIDANNPLTRLLSELNENSSYSTLRNAANILSLIFGGAAKGYDSRWYEPRMIEDKETGSTRPSMETKWPTEKNNIYKDGFATPPEEVTLKPGTIVQRRGDPRGTFVAPDGTLEDALSMKPGFENKAFYRYEVTESLIVQAGPAAPWFDQPGGGMQYKLPFSVESTKQLSQIFYAPGVENNVLTVVGVKIAEVLDYLLGGGYLPVREGDAK